MVRLSAIIRETFLLCKRSANGCNNLKSVSKSSGFTHQDNSRFEAVWGLGWERAEDGTVLGSLKVRPKKSFWLKLWHVTPA